MCIVPFVPVVLNAIAALVHASKGNTAWVVLNVGAIIVLMNNAPAKGK